MENKFINRYNTFCKSLSILQKQNSRPQDRFCSRRNCSQFQSYFRHLLESYERYSDQKMGILDFAVGSPRETLQQAFTNGIIDDDTWLQMLKSRNHLSHDYDGTFAAEKFQDIINIYYPLLKNSKTMLRNIISSKLCFVEESPSDYFVYYSLKVILKLSIYIRFIRFSNQIYGRISSQ